MGKPVAGWQNTAVMRTPWPSWGSLTSHHHHATLRNTVGTADRQRQTASVIAGGDTVAHDPHSVDRNHPS
jgi:hypothetical protein